MLKSLGGTPTPGTCSHVSNCSHVSLKQQGRDARDASVGNMAASLRCGSSTQRLEQHKRFSKLKMPTSISETTVSKGGTAQTT
ncbi:hypothetical protein ACFX2G_035147 [Malus domestica]